MHHSLSVNRAIRLLKQDLISLEPGYNTSLSPVSDDASRVCICDVNGKPQCEQTVSSMYVYPGHLFTIEAVAVGGAQHTEL